MYSGCGEFSERQNLSVPNSVGILNFKEIFKTIPNVYAMLNSPLSLILFHYPLQEIHWKLLNRNDWLATSFYFKGLEGVGNRRLVPPIPSYSLFLNIFLLLMCKKKKKVTDLPCEVENRDTG